MEEDPRIQTAIKNLFIGCVPERKIELENLWAQYQTQFNLLDDIHDGERLIIDAGQYRHIRFNHRILRATWIAAYIAWEAYVLINQHLNGAAFNSRVRTY